MNKLNVLWLGLLIVGCGQYPNPNDLGLIDQNHRVEIANKRLESAETTLEFKVVAKEITDERRNQLIKELAEDMLKKIDAKVVADTDQWMYAALLRVTDRWPEAETALRIAVKVAPNADRKINDTLKLAQAEAKNQKVDEAIATANSVLNAPDKEAAPILPSILYEVVPAAQGKGHDKELATLLEKAIIVHQRVKVDPNTDSGKLFLIARGHHLGKAAEKLGELNGSKI
jgi:hypothetical protein